MHGKSERARARSEYRNFEYLFRTRAEQYALETIRVCVCVCVPICSVRLRFGSRPAPRYRWHNKIVPYTETAGLLLSPVARENNTRVSSAHSATVGFHFWNRGVRGGLFVVVRRSVYNTDTTTNHLTERPGTHFSYITFCVVPCVCANTYRVRCTHRSSSHTCTNVIAPERKRTDERNVNAEHGRRDVFVIIFEFRTKLY